MIVDGYEWHEVEDGLWESDAAGYVEEAVGLWWAYPNVGSEASAFGSAWPSLRAAIEAATATYHVNRIREILKGEQVEDTEATDA